MKGNVVDKTKTGKTQSSKAAAGSKKSEKTETTKKKKANRKKAVVLKRRVKLRRRCRAISRALSRIHGRVARKKRRNRRKKARRRAKSQEKKSNSSKPTDPQKKKAKDERKAKKKRAKKRREKKVLRRRNRARRHLPRMSEYDVKFFKANVKNNEKWKADVIYEKLRDARRRKLRFIRRIKQFKIHASKPKRRAAKAIRRADRVARHRRKKHKRYRRNLKRWARTKGRLLQQKSKKKMGVLKPNVKRVAWKRVVTERKRVPYPRRFPMKVTVWNVEPASQMVHLKGDMKHTFANEPYMFTAPAVGNFGVIPCKNLMSHIRYNFRYQTHLTHDGNGSKEARIVAQLNAKRSENTVHIQAFGQFTVIQWFITTLMLDKNLEDVIRTKKINDTRVFVHVARQTLFCLRDLHKIGYAHLQVRPSSFSFIDDSPHILVFHNFRFAEKREECEEKSRLTTTFDLKALNTKFYKKTPFSRNSVDAYMSRRQHFRMVQGAADDYESWFYTLERILHGKELEWANIQDHWKMAMAKYEFLKSYKTKDQRMREILKYVSAVNGRKAEKVAYFIGKILKEWQGKVGEMEMPPPWAEQNKKKKKNSKPKRELQQPTDPEEQMKRFEEEEKENMKKEKEEEEKNKKEMGGEE